MFCVDVVIILQWGLFPCNDLFCTTEEISPFLSIASFYSMGCYKWSATIDRGIGYNGMERWNWKQNLVNKLYEYLYMYNNVQ